MPLVSAVTQILGGLVFFIFGLQVITKAFERLSGAYLKVAVNLLARNRLTAVVAGAIMSFLLASTSSATVLIVGMGNAGLLTLRQALAVTLGAAIGTTLTVQVIAFDVGNWAIYLAAAGLLVRSLARYERRRDIGSAAFGVGLLFFGLSMMKWGVQTSTAAESLIGFRDFLARMSANPFYLFLAGAAATAILQSSATTVAMAFALNLPVGAALPLALGASVGTCAAGLVTGAAAGPTGKRIAMGHLVMKLLGASFFMMILSHFTDAVVDWNRELGITTRERVIANAYTLYNVLNAVIFLPLIPAVAEFVQSVTGRSSVPAPVEGMSLENLEDPPRALENARRQAVKMGRIAVKMVREDLTAFLVNAHKVTDEITAGEEALDTYDAVLSDFLARIDDSRLEPRDRRRRSALLYAVKDIEHIGDVLAQEMVPLARKKARKGLDFSIEGAQQFERLHRLVADDLQEAIDLLEGIPADAARVLANEARVDALRREAVESHIRRISEGVTADEETTRILLDAVASLRSIHYYAGDIVKVLES